MAQVEQVLRNGRSSKEGELCVQVSLPSIALRFLLAVGLRITPCHACMLLTFARCRRVRYDTSRLAQAVFTLLDTLKQWMEEARPAITASTSSAFLRISPTSDCDSLPLPVRAQHF